MRGCEGYPSVTPAMKLFIKNMVCNRCIMVVEAELEKFGLHPIRVELGEAEIKEELTQRELSQLEKRLQDLGFEFMSDRRTRLVEQMKKAIIDLVYQQENLLKSLCLSISPGKSGRTTPC